MTGVERSVDSLSAYQFDVARSVLEWGPGRTLQPLRSTKTMQAYDNGRPNTLLSYNVLTSRIVVVAFMNNFVHASYRWRTTRSPNM